MTGQQYASADCSGDPIFEWDTTPIASSYATSSDVCVPIDGGSTSIRNEWCDFSGDVPRLHGTVFPGVSDCSGFSLPYGLDDGFGNPGGGWVADGSCSQIPDAPSRRFHCQRDVPNLRVADYDSGDCSGDPYQQLSLIHI